MTIPFDALAADYRRLWAAVRLRPARIGEARDTAGKILRDRARYEAVAADERARAPWWWIGAVHHMECDGRFDQHLANGDPLTARTRNVPAGLPKTGRPPFTFEEGAIAALEIKHVADIAEWPVERALYEWERYNGFGYRNNHPGTLSPYLWSGTEHYTAGKYVRDHQWSASAVSSQIGAAAILVALLEICPEIGLAAPDGAVVEAAPPLKGYELQAIQTGLKTLGYYTGTPDGLPGRLTTQAIAGFRHDHGMPPGVWDTACREALDAALAAGRTATVSEARATATVADLADHPQIQAATADKRTAILAGGGAVVAGIRSIAGDGDPVDQAQHLADKATQAYGLAGPVLSWLGAHPGVVGAAVVIGLAGWAFVRARGLEAQVVALFRSGRDGG